MCARVRRADGKIAEPDFRRHGAVSAQLISIPPDIQPPNQSTLFLAASVPSPVWGVADTEAGVTSLRGKLMRLELLCVHIHVPCVHPTWPKLPPGQAGCL